MKNKTTHLPESKPIPRQLTFNFTGPQLWEQIPLADRESCKHSLSLLLLKAVANTKEDNNTDERKNPN